MAFHSILPQKTDHTSVSAEAKPEIERFRRADELPFYPAACVVPHTSICAPPSSFFFDVYLIRLNLRVVNAIAGGTNKILGWGHGRHQEIY